MSNNETRRHRQKYYIFLKNHVDDCLKRKVTYEDILECWTYLYNWDSLNNSSLEESLSIFQELFKKEEYEAIKEGMADENNQSKIKELLENTAKEMRKLNNVVTPGTTNIDFITLLELALEVPFEEDDTL